MVQSPRGSVYIFKMFSFITVVFIGLSVSGYKSVLVTEMLELEWVSEIFIAEEVQRQSSGIGIWVCVQVFI